MAIGCIDPSNLLEDDAVLILSDFVEPFPDEVPIHSAGRLSRDLIVYTSTTVVGTGIAFLRVALIASLSPSPVAWRVREQIAVNRLAAKAGDNCQPALLLPIKGRQGSAEAPRAVKRSQA